MSKQEKTKTTRKANAATETTAAQARGTVVLKDAKLPSETNWDGYAPFTPFSCVDETSAPDCRADAATFERSLENWFIGRMEDDASFAVKMRQSAPCGLVYDLRNFDTKNTQGGTPPHERDAFVEMLQYHVANWCDAIQELALGFDRYDNYFDDFTLHDHMFANDVEDFFGMIREMPKERDANGGARYVDLYGLRDGDGNNAAFINCPGVSLPNDGKLGRDGILEVISDGLGSLENLVLRYRDEFFANGADAETAQDIILDLEDLRPLIVTNDALDWDVIEETHKRLREDIRRFRKTLWSVCRRRELDRERGAGDAQAADVPAAGGDSATAETQGNDGGEVHDDAGKIGKKQKQAHAPKDDVSQELLEWCASIKTNHPNKKYTECIRAIYDDQGSNLRYVAHILYGENATMPGSIEMARLQEDWKKTPQNVKAKFMGQCRTWGQYLSYFMRDKRNKGRNCRVN